MNVRAAENFLACHRDGVRAEASVEKALKMAESDERMREQLRVQTAFDAQMVDAIHCIKPPEDLRKKIAEGAPPKELRKNAWHPTILCAIAGGLLTIGFLVHLEMEQRAGFPGKENAERMIGQLGHMEEKRTTVAGLADWFMLRGFDGMGLPPDVAALPAVGARTFESSGHSVGQVAIESHAAVLNVFRASDFGIELEQDGAWKIFERDEWAAAIRQRGDICTLVAFHGSSAEMEEFVRRLKP